MKVLDLQCEHSHLFEGWFGSEGDFQDQLARGLVQCPLCGNATVTKRLSAPRLNFGKSRQPVSDAASTQAQPSQSTATPTASAPTSTLPSEVAAMPPTEHALATAWLAMTRRIMAHTEDVGSKFAEEARKIHYGETEERGIRGRATLAETEALLEEGIGVMPFFVPDALKGPVQ